MSAQNHTETIVETLAADFRHHLEHFYAALRLAPPYHSIEKALRALGTAVRRHPREERHRLLDDPHAKWALFGQAFAQSGLHLKHRGIIRGLIHSQAAADLPPDYRVFAEHFRISSQELPSSS